jgi:hypothetical protein
VRRDVFSVWPGGQSVFPDGDVLFVSDQQYVVDFLVSRGLPAEHLAEVTTPPESVVLIGCDYRALGPREQLHELFSNSRVLWVPLVSFDPRPEAGRYSLDLLLSSDLAAAAKGNRDWVSVLRRARRPLKVSSERSELTFQVVSDRVVLVTRVEPELAAGEFVSVAEYFEVDVDSSLDVTAGPDGAGEGTYTADGTFWAEGLCVARHSVLDFDAPQLQTARGIAGRVAQAGGILIRVENCHIVSAVCAGTDFAATLADCAGENASRLVEFSFGTNTGIVESLDWSVNSQINEGASGIHMGLGDGVTGAHIDFVLPGAKVELART